MQVNEETRHGYLGHTILHPLKKLVYPLTWGGPSEGVVGGFDYPAMAHQADKAHEQGAMVTWAHFPGPGGEVAIDIALGKIDSVDLFTWGNPFIGFPTPQGTAPSGLSVYYKFLNTGAILPATAGTDKMLNTQVSGSVRTYVYFGKKKLSYQNWVNGIKKGNTFVTTGPMLSFSVDGKPIGSVLKRKSGDRVTLSATVNSAIPVKTLEFIFNGEVIGVIENADEKLQLEIETDVRIEESSWAVVRTIGGDLPYQNWPFLGTTSIPLMAHSSPIYIDVDGKPRTDKSSAADLGKRCDDAIEWINTTARFKKPEHKREMLELFQRAQSYYRAQL